MLHHKLIVLFSITFLGACGQEAYDKNQSQSQIHGAFDGWKKDKDDDKGKDKGGKFGWGKKRKKKQVLTCRIVVVNRLAITV